MPQAEDPIPLKTLVAGDSQFDQIVELAEFLRLNFVAAMPEDAGTPEGQALAMTAAEVFSGILFGGLIIGGVVSDQDKRRAADMAARNFRTGVDIGKRRALRIAAEQRGGNA